MRRPRVLLPAAAYLALVLAWSWPLPLHLADRFTHDPGDPLLVTYLLWWNAQAVPLTAAWWNAPFFWPLPDALALTEHLAGLSPFATPIQWLGGSPLLAYNLLLIASSWWTLLATHALVRRLTNDEVAAACAAIAFAFAPYRTAQLGHLQLYACWWMPLCLLALHAYAESGERRWLIVFGVSWMLQALTNGYSLLFLPLLLGAWIAWFTPWRTRARRGVEILAAWILFSLPLLPILLHYREVQGRLGLVRSREEILTFSSGVRDFLAATPNLLFWKTLEPATSEGYLFPGVTVVLLVAAAIVRRTGGRVFWFYVASALAAAWLCTGPSVDGSVGGLLRHPYDLLLRLPGFDGVRVPARFFMIAALSLAIAAGIAFAQLRVRRPGLLLTVVVFGGLAVDGAIGGMPIGRPPGAIDGVPRGARIMSLPLDDARVTVGTLYRSMEERLSVVNGYAGYTPPHAAVIEWALRRQDPSILTELRRGRPLFVLVGSGDEAPLWSAFMDAQPEARMTGVTGGGRLYEMSPAPYKAIVQVGPALQPRQVEAVEGWLAADLGARATVRAVDLWTRGNVTRLPDLVRVESSMDGRTWSVAAEEAPGGLALAGALADPLGVPIRIVLPDVAARFVRINAPWFRPAMLTIHGP
jgi:hypothetical protein